MKSFFSLLFALFIFVSVIGVAGLLWYLSATSEFSRKEGPAAAAPPAGATPQMPQPQQTPPPPVPHPR